MKFQGLLRLKFIRPLFSAFCLVFKQVSKINQSKIEIVRGWLTWCSVVLSKCSRLIVSAFSPMPMLLPTIHHKQKQNHENKRNKMIIIPTHESVNTKNHILFEPWNPNWYIGKSFHFDFWVIGRNAYTQPPF